MPGRKEKPPRLWQRADGAWVILDRGRYIRTGCKGGGAGDVARAADALESYLNGRHQPARGERNPDRLPIADVLVAYEDAKAPPDSSRDCDRLRRHDELIGRLQTLNEFFGADMVGQIRAQRCRDFVAWRTGERAGNGLPPPRRRMVTAATARRELEDLRAAVNCYHADYVLNALPKITLPAKAMRRERWLTRGEAARLLGACLGFVWDPATAAFKRDAAGRLVRRGRSVRARRAHIARFVLLGLYSGRREATIRRTEWSASVAAPWLDLERWIYHGRGRDERETKKRRPKASVAFRLRPHLTRWQRLDRALGAGTGRAVRHVVHKANGEPLRGKIKTGWNGCLGDAGLAGGQVVRHTLKHTAATWLMQKGIGLWAAAGFLGITVEQLDEGYGHHHPDFQAAAAGAFGGRR